MACMLLIVPRSALSPVAVRPTRKIAVRKKHHVDALVLAMSRPREVISIVRYL